MENSRIKIKTIGGNLDSVIGLLDGTKPQVISYLKGINQDKTGATANALFCEFKFLKDNQVAKIILATDEYIVRNCEVLPLGDYTIKKPVNFHLFIKPKHTGGDNSFGHAPYQINLKVSLITKNKRETWVKVDAYLREVWSRTAYGDTEASFSGEFLLDKSLVPGDEEIMEYGHPVEEYTLIVPGIDHDSPFFVGEHVGHGHGVKFNPQTNPALMPDPGKRFAGLVREVVANSGHDGPDFPADGSVHRNYLKILFHDIVVKTRKL